MHVALARRTGNPAFDPEPVGAADLERWAAAVRAECASTLERISQRRSGWPEPLAALGLRVVGAKAKLMARIDNAGRAKAKGLKTRLHGDLHLGQVLICRDDFMLIDFEGEPTRALEDRRAKHCALRDVAGMLRSFDYARHTALNRTARSAPEFERLAPVAREWERRVREAFLRTYSEVAVAGRLYDDAAAFEQVQATLELFELEKALYEVRYEMDHRPDWVGVSLAGIAAMAGVAESA
jgi:maltose alpha-D-glucosyltransferase/alpha-amylase